MTSPAMKLIGQISLSTTQKKSSGSANLLSIYAPHPDDGKFGSVAGEERNPPGVVEGHAITPVAKVIDPAPPRLHALRRGSDHQARLGIPELGGVPARAVAPGQGVVAGPPAVRLVGADDVDVGVLSVPHPTGCRAGALVVVTAPVSGGLGARIPGGSRQEQKQQNNVKLNKIRTLGKAKTKKT